MLPTDLRASAAAPIRHLRPRPYTPRTNGKAERFIQTLLREWAYRRPYPSSRHRTEALPAGLYYYNWARRHGALHGRPPITRLVAPNKDLVWFAFYTGWRKAEVVGLTWSMVDTAAGTLILPDSKNGRGRVLALSGELAAIMERREEARLFKDAEGEPRVSDWVFHRSGRPVGDFKKSWHSALVKAGLTHLEKAADGSVTVVHDRLFHDLRRTAVRN